MGDEFSKFSSASSSDLTENARNEDVALLNIDEPNAIGFGQEKKRKPRGTPMRGGYKKVNRRSGLHNPPMVIDGTTVQCSFEETSNEVTIKRIVDLMEGLMAKRCNHAA